MSLHTNNQQQAFSTRFWDTIFGKVIRWAVYIPTAVVLLLIVEVLSLLFCAWLFGNMSTFVTVGLLFGGIGFLWLGPLAYYGIVLLTTQIICPTPRVGAIIFATLYVLWSTFAFVSLLMSELYGGEFVMLALLRLVFTITATVAVVNVYSEDISRTLESATSRDDAGIERRVAVATTKANKLGRDADNYIYATAANKTRFDVVLDDFGDLKIGVIKVVRETTGLSLKEAKDLVEGAPSKVKAGLSKEDAQYLKAELEAVGASVSIVGYLAELGMKEMCEQAEHTKFETEQAEWDAWLEAEDAEEPEIEADEFDDAEHDVSELQRRIEELKARVDATCGAGANNSKIGEAL